jgi:class 3 adenylate cyclase/predicted ATPase
MQEISNWLRKLGLGQYAQRFVENDINFAILPDLTDQDLKELGVHSLGHRRQLLRAIAERKDDRKTASPAVSSSAAAPDAEAPPVPQDAAERRQLTVMFCDLVGSTALSARLDPEDLRGIIGAYHRCCTELIERNGGFVAKYMGDGVLAYFGYPQAHEHDAERAVRAGLAFIQAVPKLATSAGSRLQVRVGIATGLVVVGDLIGAGAAQEQTVVGETANLAARLQTLAEPGAVVIASSTRAVTGGLFEYRDLGAVALKGFADHVQTWQVLGASAAESRFEALRATTTPLVGREEEIELLLRRWEQAKRGDGCVVLISGEPGIGKSRIAQIVLERISAEPHTRQRYFCSPHHQDSALYPSVTQLERAAGFRREDTSQQRLAKLEAVLSQGTNDLSEVVPLLANLLSIPIGDRYPPLNLTPQKRKEKTLRAQLAQVEGLAACQPVLMVFEDVHWCDPTTRESLDLLVDRVATLRVLVIITFRPEFTPPWIGRPHVMLLTLTRLPLRQRIEMMAHVTCGKAFPKEIADQIVDRTDGVPLFIEELTKSVMESGIITQAGDHYAVSGPVTPIAIPTSLHASLLARLDRLASSREVAQIAAALGRSFSHDLISAVAAMPQQRLDDALGQLVSAELMFRRGAPPDAEYTFKHALVQDAAYSTLLRSRRQQLHSRVAATLERQFPEIVAAQPEVLAYHFTQANLTEPAIEWWSKAGQKSLERSGSVEAFEQFTRALALIATLPSSPRLRREEIKLQVALLTPIVYVKGWAAPEAKAATERARLLIEQAEARGEPPEDPMLLFSVLSRFFGANIAAFNGDVSRDLAAQFLELAEKQSVSYPRILGRTFLGGSLMLRGELRESTALLSDQASALYDPVRHQALAFRLEGQDHRVTTPFFRSKALWLLGHPDAARVDSDQALKDGREIGHAPSLLWALAGAFFIDIACGDYATANARVDECIALADEKNAAFWKAFALMGRGWLLSLTGRVSDAVETMTAGTTAMHSAGATVWTPFFLSELASAYAELGQREEAWRYVGEAIAMVETAKQRWCEAEVNRVGGKIALMSPEPDGAKAEAYFDRALTVARKQQAKAWELHAAMSMARLWRDQGKRQQAHDLLAPVYGWFTEGFDTLDLKEAKALLDELTQ